MRGSPSVEYLAGVWGTAPGDIFAVGYPGTILHYDGAEWSEMRGGPLEALEGVWGSSSRDVYAVGYDNSHSTDIIIHYDGAQWNSTTVGTGHHNDVWGSSPRDVFAVGYAATILHYDGELTPKVDPLIDGPPPGVEQWPAPG